MVCDFIERGGDVGGAGERFAKAVSPGFDFERDLDARGDREPDHHARRRVAGHRRGDPAAASPRRYGDDGGVRPLPLVRHDLLGDPGAAGRGAGAAGGSARRDGGRRRLQLEQHLPPRGAGAVERRAVLPRRGRGRRGPRGRHHPPSADRRQAARSATADWLGESRTIGITAGASTPNNKVGETIDADLRDGRRRPRSSTPRPREPPRMRSSISATPSPTA